MDEGSVRLNQRTYSILFVCTANICRSPMAMALFRARLAREGELKHWRIESAGTWTDNGEPASQGAAQAMSLLGLDLSEHRSRIVSAELLDSYDLILTMTQNHKEALRVEFPQLAPKIFQLAEMAGVEQASVADPYGGSPEEYQATAREIETWLERGYPEILKRVRGNEPD